MKSLFQRMEGSLAIGICCLLSCQLSLPTALAQTLPTSINVVVIEGEGAINNVRQRVARDPVVRVEDENHRPVAGAAIVFTLPVSGPGGEFSNGSKTLTVMTDDEGTAVAHGLKLNQAPGKLQIYVTASYRGLRARALITQTIQGGGAQSHGGNSKLIAILAVVGAAAAGGAVLATRKSGSSSSTPGSVTGPTPIGITPGTPTLSPPR